MTKTKVFWYFRFINILYFILTLFSSETLVAQTSLDPSLNDELLEIYRTRQSTSHTNTMPQELYDPLATLRSNGIHTFNTTQELAQSPEMAEVVFQEFLRNQTWGMPYLPITWMISHTDVEGLIVAVDGAFEQNLRNRARPLSDDNVYLFYLLVGTIFHGNNADAINTFRNLAETLAASDSSFTDIRQEIHQHPTVATVARIQSFIQGLNPNNPLRPEFIRLRQVLSDFFGGGSVDSFLRRFNGIPANEQQILQSGRAALTAISRARTQSEAAGLVDATIRNLSELARLATSLGARLRSDPFSSCADNDAQVNCGFEHVDYLRIIHSLVFGLGNTLQDRISSLSIPVSASQITAVIQSYIAVASAVGMYPSSVARQIATRLAQLTLQSGSTPVFALIDYLNEVEAGNRGLLNRVRQIFNPVFQTYAPLIPAIQASAVRPLGEIYTQQLIRASLAVPLSVLNNRLARALLARMDSILNLGTRAFDHAQLSVLNPGIAQGRLIIPTEAELLQEDFPWDPNGIYFLRRTPATLGLVRGVITCDAGSNLSHVSLLTQNHGIPNLFVPCGYIRQIQTFANQEVFFAALPNGIEATLRLVSQMSELERQVYLRFTEARRGHRIHLARPTGLHINWILRLDQLRATDVGIVAGGKACGQGEIAAATHHRVAEAVVLPFGVYATAIHQTGLDARMEQWFRDPRFQSDPEFRRAILNRVRNEITTLTIPPAVERNLRTILSNAPFRDRGVFVRSDTNAEDLAEFVGAGLNQTEPNVMGIENIIGKIKEVWASPFREQAIAWRSDLIDNPWEVFPSVIIQLAIPAEKSGVMLVGSRSAESDFLNEVSIAANEGVGGVVNGQPAEEIIYYRQDLSVSRIAPARARIRRALNPQGGLQILPATQTHPILSDLEIRRLAYFGDVLQHHMLNVYHWLGKWDIEWGMVDGYPILLQMRPFVGNPMTRHFPILHEIETHRNARPVTPLSLNSRDLILPTN